MSNYLDVLSPSCISAGNGHGCVRVRVSNVVTEKRKNLDVLIANLTLGQVVLVVISVCYCPTDQKAFQGDWCPSRCQIHRPNIYDPGMSCKCFRCHPLHCSWSECCKNFCFYSLHASISLTSSPRKRKGHLT